MLQPFTHDAPMPRRTAVRTPNTNDPVQPSQVARDLKALRQEAGLSRAALARALGYADASSLQHYEDRYKKKHLPRELVDQLVPIFEARGIAPGRTLRLAGVDAHSLANVSDKLSLPIRYVPLISWSQAHNLREAIKAAKAGNAESYVPFPSKGQSYVALPVIDRSMDRVAPPGSVIIVDYEDHSLVDKKSYLLKIAGAVTFRRFRGTDGPLRFEPYSTEPDHETVYPGDATEVLGRVIRVLIEP